MTEQRDPVLDLVRRANPRPTGSAGPAGEWSSTQLLAHLEERNTGMDTKRDLDATPVERAPTRKDRRPWLVAAVAFAVAAVIIGGALFALGGGSPTEPAQPLAPTTTQATTTTQAPDTTVTAEPATTTTTTAAPQVDPADQAVIDAFVETFNAGDWQATMAALAPDALVRHGFIMAGGDEEFVPRSEFDDLIGRLMRFHAIQESRIDLNSCTPFDDGRVNCLGTFSDIVTEASPIGEAGLSIIFGINDAGQVSSFSFRENSAAMAAAYTPFGTWMEANHADEVAVLFLGGTTAMNLSEEALDLLPVRVAEWLATLQS